MAQPNKPSPAKAPPAKPEAEKKPAKPAVSSGNYHAAVCGDGISTANFEKLSAKAAGKTVEEWRKSVIEALQTASNQELKDVGNALAGQTKGTTAWNSPDQLQNVLDGKVKGLEDFAGNGSGYNQHKRPMWGYLKKKGLAYEADWQVETAVSFVNKAGQRSYADAAEIPYFVAPASSGIKPGTYAKITANGHSVYARMLERGPAVGELSLKTWEGLGYSNVTPNAAPTSDVKIDVFDNSGGMNTSAEDGYLNYDEIQRAGKLIEDGKAQSIKSRQELEDAEKKAGVTQPEPQKQAGLLLEKGFPTVAIGEPMHRVGYACEDCIHQGGGYVIEGSSTVYVGKYPFARIADATSDGLGVVSGADTVFVGGTPTSATLA